MKNNYNPYTVPEDFLETSCKQAVSQYRRRRCTIRLSLSAMAVAALVFALPLFFNHPVPDKQQEKENVENNLADLYEYDIFLQVNFENNQI